MGDHEPASRRARPRWWWAMAAAIGACQAGVAAEHSRDAGRIDRATPDASGARPSPDAGQRPDPICARCPGRGARDGIFVCARPDSTVPRSSDRDFRHTGSISCPLVTYPAPDATCAGQWVPVTRCSKRRRPCAARANQCCRQDGTIVIPCGQVGTPGCNAPATCRGSDGYCWPCRCLVAGTAIATPTGDVAVEDVGEGTVVWTLDEQGRRVAAPVLRAHRTLVLGRHHVVRLRLADGRSLRVSAPHPTADGRTLGALTVGDELDGSRIVERSEEPYAGEVLFDLRPRGGSGAYIANGIRVGSTLP